MTNWDYFERVVAQAEQIIAGEVRPSVAIVHWFLVGTIAQTDIAEHGAYAQTWSFDLHVALLIHAMQEGQIG